MILLKIHAPQFDKEPELLGLNRTASAWRAHDGDKRESPDRLGHWHPAPTVLDAGDRHC